MRRQQWNGAALEDRVSELESRVDALTELVRRLRAASDDDPENGLVEPPIDERPATGAAMDPDVSL